MQNSPAVRRFDRDRFQRLLDLIGPSETPAFLTQLAQDLSGCADAIARATGTQDWDGLRGASHVLISLSGSVGAMSLQALAERLNLAASGGDAAALADLTSDLDGDLSALLVLVRAAHTKLAHTKLAHTKSAHTKLAHTKLAHTKLAHTKLAHTKLAPTKMARPK